MQPTPNKVRETLFNWIQFEIFDKVCLDLFAGSGALGLEALSRGAKKVVSVEKNYKSFTSLIANKHKIGTDKIDIFNKDAFKFLLNKSNQIFNFIFLDPPFNKNIIVKVLKLLVAGSFVACGSKIYIESEYKISKQDISMELYKANIIKQKLYGQVHCCLIELG